MKTEESNNIKELKSAICAVSANIKHMADMAALTYEVYVPAEIIKTIKSEMAEHFCPYAENHLEAECFDPLKYSKQRLNFKRLMYLIGIQEGSLDYDRLVVACHEVQLIHLKEEA